MHASRAAAGPLHAPPSSPAGAGGRRRGAILTTEMLFVLPVLVVTGLIILQAILAHMSYQRVQAAAIAGADVAANGRPFTEVYSQVILVLGYLASDAEVKMQYVDDDGDLPPAGVGTIEQNDDFVAVGVRIPMGLTSTNYLGLLGGSYNDLQIRSVVCKRMAVSVSVGP